MRRIDFTARLPFKLVKKAKWYVAFCPILDIYSQGETEESAKKNLAEALTAFLISCFERNALDEVLKNCGFQPGILPISLKKAPSAPAKNLLDVSIPFLIDQSRKYQCHV